MGELLDALGYPSAMLVAFLCAGVLTFDGTEITGSRIFLLVVYTALTVLITLQGRS